MTIYWYGEACFLLEAGGMKILIEPPTKESGLFSPRFKSDILIYSKDRPSEAGPEPAAFVINGAGEYEIKGVNISGINDGGNIIYNIEADGIRITHLGFLSKEPGNEQLEAIDDPNIILVPVGGSNVLDAEAAMELINKIEPEIVIPMLYDIKGLKIKRAPLADFIKESEAKDAPLPKLAVKKKDLVEEETKIVILEKV